MHIKDISNKKIAKINNKQYIMIVFFLKTKKVNTKMSNVAAALYICKANSILFQFLKIFLKITLSEGLLYFYRYYHNNIYPYHNSLIFDNY